MTNRTLLKIINAKLDDTKGAWPEELPSVLWAYKTTVRTPIGETPFKLTYGTEAVISVKVGVASVRWEMLSRPKPDTRICDHDRHANIKPKPNINKNQLNF